MNKKQNAKVNSLISSDKVLEENINVWQHIAGIAASRSNFSNLLGLLDNKSVLQKSGNNQVITNKTGLRTRLERQTMLVYTSFKGTATNSGDEKQKAQLSYSSSQLTRLRELDLADTAIMIYTAAKPVAADLALYIPESDIDLLQSLALEYKKSITDPRVEVSKSSVTTVNIEETIQGMSDIFEHEIDHMVAPFEFLNPDFFRTYRNARKIVGPGSRKRSKDDGETDASKGGEVK